MTSNTSNPLQSKIICSVQKVFSPIFSRDAPEYIEGFSRHTVMYIYILNVTTRHFVFVLNFQIL